MTTYYRGRRGWSAGPRPTIILCHARHGVRLWQLGPCTELCIAPVLASLRHHRDPSSYDLSYSYTAIVVEN